MSVPIILRTRNRAVFLDTTIKSLLATDLPEDVRIVVSDDCSDDSVAVRYLTTNDEIVLDEPYKWSESPVWINNVGVIPTVKTLYGIKDKLEVVQSDKKKGVRGGIFWNINYGFERFKDSEAIIVVEADVVFHKDWYKVIVDSYDKCKCEDGPNGDYLGLLSAYDRKGREITDKYRWAWRSVKKLSNGNWGCGNGIGGCQYLVTREFYNRAKSSFTKFYNPELRSGDTALQAECGVANCNIAVTVPSLIQHAGICSLAWPTKGWRHTKNFLKPFAWRDAI